MQLPSFLTSRRARHVEAVRLLLFVLLLCILWPLWPLIDVWVTGWFYEGNGAFPIGRQAWARAIYGGWPKVGMVFLLVALVLGLTGLVPRLRGLASRLRAPRHLRRRSLALVLATLLGVQFVVHDVLKDNWGRPRPAHTQDFGGQASYVPPLLTSDQCRRNCSFVSGHAAGGFVLMALGLMGAPATRRRWRRIGFAAGGIIGAARIVQGGHYLSDILFAGAFIWASCWLIREAWLRVAVWRKKRRSRLRVQT